jgi:hypothetical protein
MVTITGRLGTDHPSTIVVRENLAALAGKPA